MSRTAIASTRLPFDAVQMLSVPGGLLVASRHELFLVRLDLKGKPRSVWKTGRDILQLTAVKRGWLALVADGANSPHPQRGAVYMFSADSTRHPKLLSLRSIYNFWHIQAADVDGDGHTVIGLCTWSETRVVHQYARRFFIYGLHNGDTYPRWRGSRLSKPYQQATLAKFSASDWKLFSVEQSDSDHVCLMAYSWQDFGFTGIGRQGNFDRAALIPNDYGVPAVRATARGKERLVCATVNRDSLRLRPIVELHRGDDVVIGRFKGSGFSAIIVPQKGITASRIEQLPGISGVKMPEDEGKGP